jgi:predicted esterase
MDLSNFTISKTVMPQSNLKNITDNSDKQPLSILKTVVICVGVILFCLLNVVVLLNAESLIPDERTQRLLWFGLKPEFWANWYSLTLWILATGFVLSTILRLSLIQKQLNLLTQISFPQPILFIRWSEYLNQYPLERRFLLFLQMGKHLFLSCIRPRNIPTLVLCLFILISCRIILVNASWGDVLLKFAYRYIIFIPKIPYWIVQEFYTAPLTNLIVTGIISWKLVLTAILVFLAIVGCIRYGQKIKRSSRRKEQMELLARYSIAAIVFVVTFCFAHYLLFLIQTIFHIICLPFAYLDKQCHGIRFALFHFYDEYTVIPFYLFLNEGILSRKLAVSLICHIIILCGTYFYFRHLFYSPDRWKKLYKTLRILILPLLIFYFIFHQMINSILSQLYNGLFQIYYQIVRIPSNVWDCVYFAPCYFLYYSVATWKLFVAPIILFVFFVGLYLNPFRRYFKTIPFSPTLFYVTFWTILFCSCFFILIWKTILFVLFLSIIYYIVQCGVPLPKIKITLSPKFKRILYHLFICFLTLFDIATISWDIFISFRYYRELYLFFFYKPVLAFFLTGQVSWLLIVPSVMFFGVLFAFVNVFLLKRPLKLKIKASIPQIVFFVSIMVIIILLDTICFIYAFIPDTKIQWLDIRFLPCWALLIPLSLITLSLSGLRLLHSKKTIILPLIVVMILCISNTTIAAEKQIILIEPAKFVSSRDVRLTANNESRQSGGGYVAEPKIVDCFAAMEYNYTGGRFKNQPIRFRLRMPGKIKPNKKYPLIIWFHGQGESSNDNTRQLSHLQKTMEFFAGSNQRDFFMLATQCPQDNNRWEHSLAKDDDKGDAPLTITGEIIEAIIQEFPIDVNRISVTGVSSGGSAAWEFVRQHPRRFAALAPASGRPPEEAAPEPFLGTVIWAFNNRGDSGTPFDKTEQLIEVINANGGNAYLTLYEVSGHDAWTAMLRDEKIIGWLILQSLADPGPPQGIICRPLSKMKQFLMFGLPVLIIISCIVLSLLYRNHEEH